MGSAGFASPGSQSGNALRQPAFTTCHVFGGIFSIRRGGENVRRPLTKRSRGQITKGCTEEDCQEDETPYSLRAVLGTKIPPIRQQIESIRFRGHRGED